MTGEELKIIYLDDPSRAKAELLKLYEEHMASWRYVAKALGGVSYETLLRWSHSLDLRKEAARIRRAKMPEIKARAIANGREAGKKGGWPKGRPRKVRPSL